MMEMMKTTPYHSWLKENEDLVSDIEKVYQTGEMIQAFDYELFLDGKKHSVNYTILTLQQNEKPTLRAIVNRKIMNPLDQNLGGILLVIETISNEKRVLATLGRYMNSALAQQLMNENAGILAGQRLETSVMLTDLRACKAAA